MRNAHRLLVAVHVEGWIILKWILEKQGGRVWPGTICLRIGTSGELLLYGNEPLGSIKGEEFLI
jgi:hypothetical protein